MNKMNGNTPSEYLNQLLDGELPEGSGEDMYSFLANDEGLKQEMKELLAIRESVRKDTEAFTPPLEATRGVFNKLGINPEAATLAPAGKSALTSGAVGLLKKIWVPAAAAIVATVVTTFVVSNIYDNNQPATVSENNIPVISSVENNNAPVTSDIIEDSKKTDTRLIAKDEDTRITGNGIVSAKNNITNEPANLTTVNSNDISAMNKIYAPEIIINKSDRREVQPVSLTRNNNSGLITPANIEFSSLMEQLKIHDKSYSIAAGGLQGLNNSFSGWNLGVFIHTNEFVSLGVKFGKEPFNRLISEDIDGVEVLTGKDINMTWLAIAGRFYNQDWNLLGVTPFAQVEAGGSTEGLIGRGVLGLQYSVLDRITLSAGYESSLLYYQHQGSRTANKEGLSFGISYNLK